MRERLDTMRQAVQTVRPALDGFYRSLSDEQKARFNVLGPEQHASRQAGGKELSQVCSGEATRASLAPTEQMIQALRPNESQRAALDALNDATAKAADVLEANCLSEEMLTPPGRLAAMEKRLDAMLAALDIVQPAMARFYNSLTDEQKARFNEFGPRRQAVR
jgi:hypothetical protein